MVSSTVAMRMKSRDMIRCVFASLNFMTAIIGAGMLLAPPPHRTHCVRIIQGPVFIIGIVILCISVAGIMGTWKRLTWLLGVYLAVMVFMLLSLLCFAVFVLVSNSEGGGEAVPGKAFKEYHLGSFSNFQRSELNKGSNWQRIKTCLLNKQICATLRQTYPTLADFDNANLTPTQSGCCKPPTACGFTFVNATNWILPKTESADPDCMAWNNNSTQLCFNCNSCQAGVIQRMKDYWHTILIVHLVLLGFLIFVCSSGYVVYRATARAAAAAAACSTSDLELET
eukprot:c53545_g1_i1 orf=331-1179(-)